MASTGRFMLGRDNFAKISAIEGIELTPAMKAEFQFFDERRLTPAERRAEIARKYGKG